MMHAKRIRTSTAKAATVIAAMSAALAWPAVTLAQDRPPSVKGEAPPSEAEKKKSAEAKAKAAEGPFSLSGLGPVDPTTQKAIQKLDQACTASPMSREGMSAQEEARCNAAMAAVSARGGAGAAAILAALNDGKSERPYYARTQLFLALGKVQDPAVRSAVVGGLEKIAKDKLEDHNQDLWQIEDTLRTMFAGGPDPELPWDPAPTVDEWEGAVRSSVAWRKIENASAGKTRFELFAARLVDARKRRVDADPKAAFRAIAYLVRHAPREGKSAAHAYAGRKDLTPEIKSAFEDLESEAEFKLQAPVVQSVRF